MAREMSLERFEECGLPIQRGRELREHVAEGVGPAAEPEPLADDVPVALDPLPDDLPFALERGPNV
mgnify:CR=1 FL=1